MKLRWTIEKRKKKLKKGQGMRNSERGKNLVGVGQFQWKRDNLVGEGVIMWSGTICWEWDNLFGTGTI
jgi:hypothetical protein